MKATATEIVRHWSSFLAKVQQGFTIDIVKSGKTVARLSPSTGSMTGLELAAILRRQRPDAETAGEMERILKRSLPARPLCRLTALILTRPAV